MRIVLATMLSAMLWLSFVFTGAPDAGAQGFQRASKKTVKPEAPATPTPKPPPDSAILLAMATQPKSRPERVYPWARSKGVILFLDVQAGRSTINAEVARLVPFLSRPDVHLGLDPESYMHHNREGRVPDPRSVQWTRPT